MSFHGQGIPGLYIIIGLLADGNYGSPGVPIGQWRSREFQNGRKKPTIRKPNPEKGGLHRS